MPNTTPLVKIVRSPMRRLSEISRFPRELRLRYGRLSLRSRYWCTLVALDRQEWSRQLPTNPWPGDAGNGKRILESTFSFDGMDIRYNDSFWQQVDQADLHWMRQLYDFRWLQDVLAYDQNEAAAAMVRQFILDWIDGDHDASPVSRHPDIAGERLANWFAYQDFLFKGATPQFKRIWLKHQYYTLLNLERVRRRKREKTSFPVLKGLIYAALTLPSAAFLTSFAMRSLLQAMQLRFGDDGGHVSRSPGWHSEELRCLMEIRATLQMRKVMIPPQLDASLQRMLDTLATVTHPDGSLALFNDTIEAPTIDFGRLWQSWNKPQPQPQRHLPEFGFVHLARGHSRLMMDVGVPNPVLSRSFYGTLGFEFSHGLERIIVNCGGYRGNRSEWRKACKATAAHSTLSLDDANSWQSPHDAQYTLSFEPEVSCQVEEKKGVYSVDAAYNGYVPYAGLLHYRKLALSKDGNKLEGIDVLMAHKSLTVKGSHRVQIRFHLHPDMQITRISRGKIELQSKKGEQWVFETPKEFAAGVEDSVYLGVQGKPQKSLQLCIESLFAGSKDLQINWSLHKV